MNHDRQDYDYRKLQWQLHSRLDKNAQRVNETINTQLWKMMSRCAAIKISISEILVTAPSVNKTISRHFKHFLKKCEHMKTEFHNLINLKVALTNKKSYSLNYGVMVNVYELIRSVLSDQQETIVVGVSESNLA